MVEDRDRILTPMMRKDGSLKAATLDDTIAGIADLIGQSKGKTTAVVSTQLSLEAMDAFHQISEQLGISTIASTEEGLYAKEALDLLSSKGKPFETSFESIKDADCFLVVGEDLTKDHQVASFFIKRGLPVGKTLIQISAGETGFDHFANVSLRVPDNQTADFISALEAVVKSGSEKEIIEAAKKFNVDAQLLSDAINSIQSAGKFAVIYGSRYPFAEGASPFNAAVSLAEQAKGLFISTKGNINSLACAKMGLDKAVDLQSADVVILALGDEKLSQQFMKKFEKVPHLVVLASFSSPLSAAAEFVLPVANWLEQDGHFINFSGELLDSFAALKAEESVLSNLDAIEKLAKKVNVTIQPKWKDVIKTKSLVK
jgi:NADH dehydrogenase/NADH:ubiquinone oxidoreductase subunit G